MKEEKKSGFLRTIPVLITILSLSFPAYAKYSGGTGEPNDPYQIATAEDLMLLGENPEDYDKHVILTADIDLNPNLPGRKVFDRAVIAPDTDPNDEYSWFQGTPFTGVFDGNYYKISNLTIEGQSWVGLFGRLESQAIISNLGLEAIDVNGIGAYVGGLVGSNGYVRSYGEMVGGILTNCYSSGTVKGGRDVGGLVGYNAASIDTSYSTSTVSGSEDVGGLVGYNYGDLITSFSAGIITGTDYVGGLAGLNAGYSYFNSWVPFSNSWEPAMVANCYSMSSVSGSRWVGGAVGLNGRHQSSLFGSSNHPGDVLNCYAIGSVLGNEFTGGLVGGKEDGAIHDSFWNVATTGQATSAGGTGKTTSEMQAYSTFLGWAVCDEIIWTIDEGNDYPKLWWENKPGEAIKPEMFLSDFLLGTGTEDDPYLIYTAEELNLIGLGWCDWDKHFKLMEDIDLSAYKGADFNIIGYYRTSLDRKPFTGIFDGNGHTISNFTRTSTDTNRIGLFGYVHGENVQIKDLGLIDPNICSEAKSVGTLVGHLESGTIKGCYAEGGNVFSTNGSVGGLIGHIGGECTSYPHGPRLCTCISTISDCSANTSVSGSVGVGGLIGYSCSYLVTVSESYSSGKVVGASSIGGLVGKNFLGSITTSYSSGTVTGNGDVGGLVGYNWGSIATSYSTGTVNGDRDVGGLVGTNFAGEITNCYATASVSGNQRVGGLVGYNLYSFARVANSFWDMQASGQSTMCGGQYALSIKCDNSYGKTTAKMQTAATFLDAGWDFVDETENGTEDIWKIFDGLDYPRLWWEKYSSGTGDPNNPYKIATVDDLILLRESPEDYDKHFIMIDDIDLDPNLPGRKVFDRAVIAPDTNDIEPGFQGISFIGVFNGNGNTISRLTIEGGSYLGLFGQLSSTGIISNLGLEAVDVNGTDDYVGGLVGNNENGSITTSYSTGTVTGDGGVGGLVGGISGFTSRSAVLTNCYSTGAVSGVSNVGGLVGFNWGNINISYSTSTVIGENCIGGLVGYNACNIDTSYSTGTVIGNENVGGLVGLDQRRWGGEGIIIFDGTSTLSFWDMETSGQSASAGGTGKSTAEMQTASTFLETGWDFVDETDNGTDDIWWIDEGQDYPRLWWELTE